MPALAAMPERGARMPILTGLAWAMAGAKTPGEAAAAPVAAIDFRTVRRESFMGRPLSWIALRRLRRRWPQMIYQRHVTDTRGSDPSPHAWQ